MKLFDLIYKVNSINGKRYKCDNVIVISVRTPEKTMKGFNPVYVVCDGVLRHNRR